MRYHPILSSKKPSIHLISRRRSKRSPTPLQSRSLISLRRSLRFVLRTTLRKRRKNWFKVVTTVPQFSSLWAQVMDNTHMTSVAALIKVPHPPQIELVLEFGPDVPTARLLSCRRGHPRDSHRERNNYQKTFHTPDLIVQLVDPAWVAPMEIPTHSDSEIRSQRQ